MQQSRGLVTAHINFIEERLSLVRIPLDCYSAFVHAVLQLLYPESSKAARSPNGAATTEGLYVGSRCPDESWTGAHPFLNVSVTPIECSIVCSKALAEKYFLPALSSCAREGASISPEDFIAVSVEGEGLEAGQRVLELTTPLAMANISILFFTTYFSDYLLVPAKSRPQVLSALEDRGFVFNQNAHAYVNVAAQQHSRNGSSSSSIQRQASRSPTTPPPASLPELQSRTFSLLARRSIRPRAHRSLRLIACAGRSSSPVSDAALQVAVTKCLIRPPRFFSLTLTQSEDPSLLLDAAGGVLANFPADSLLASTDDYLIPLTLDLEPLPLEAAGIVCAVASKLVDDSSLRAVPGQGAPRGVEMSYLSTARGAAVMVNERELERAIDLLRDGEYGLDIAE